MKYSRYAEERDCRYCYHFDRKVKGCLLGEENCPYYPTEEANEDKGKANIIPGSARPEKRHY